ncbi:hypothetical protein CcaCcLH18_09473 [Colletotrichum camelliae]|nr:hypothetical protein CcaCcLH18_09473 [Colletotrichum camelliae]
MSSSHSDSDAIVIGRNDVSNYNPDQILPEPPEVIKNLKVWLQPTTYDLESGEYRQHLSSHTPGTGEWIASNSTYDDWLKGQEQGFLWIKGIPGSGKSVLASKIVRDLFQKQPGTPVLNFFFRKIIDANHEPIALLRDWLEQLLLYSPPLQKQIKGYVENKQSVNSQAHGVFLNAKLAMDAFLKPGADAKEVLTALPQEMSAIYSNLLREHSRGSGVSEDVQLFVLQWVTHAIRPLSLLEIDDIMKLTHSRNGDATGLKLSDLSRPQFNGNNHLLKDTARLGEIIDMLLDRGADLSWPWEGRQWDEKLAGVSTTSLGCGDYTLRCWTEASQTRQLGPHRHRFGHEETTFDEYLVKYRDEATITALRNYGGIKKGRPNRKLLWSTLKRRQYYLVEELFHCGVDFFAENQRLGLTGLEELIRGGFNCLVKRIVQLEANRRQEDDVSRVEQNMTNPRTGLDSSWMQKRDSDKSSRLFILEAIHMELPAFDVLCLLVEEFGADIDEMSFSTMKLGSHEMQTMQSALHMLARGNHWWHVAQALPYLIERGANVELRNDKGQTPLHIALECGEKIRTGPFHRDAARLFILRGADANAVDTMGRTCLTYAGSDAEMIRLLAEHGANA